MPDYAHLDNLIRNTSTSCYGCAGQRCMASSVIAAVGDDMYRKVVDRFIQDSMLCDTKMQGTSAIEFFTERKVIVERYWKEK